MEEHDLTYSTTGTSSQADCVDDPNTFKVKNYIKELLKSRLFLGRYMERRLTNQHIGYRDIVLLSAAEVDMKRDLIDAQNKLRSIYPSTHWIGITDGTPIGHPGLCLWTEIENKPFGPYWFQVRSVKFRDAEIIVTLKCVRYIDQKFLEIEPILTGTGRKKATTDSMPAADTTTETLSESFKEIIDTLKSGLSIRNLKELVTFLAAFVIAVFAGSNAFISFLGNFILALIRELSILVKNSTPMFLGFLDFLSKIVGGFYILMAMVFKPSKPIPTESDRRRIEYHDTSKRQSFSHNYEYD